MSPDWKDLYKDKWAAGRERMHLVAQRLTDWGYKAEPFGFMADSVERTPQHSPEKGIPDLRVTLSCGQRVYVEVTGSGGFTSLEAPLWIRPDKAAYAPRHPRQDCWVAYVLDGLTPPNLRFVRLGFPLDRYKTIRPVLRGTEEGYLEIPANAADVVDEAKFRAYLDSFPRRRVSPLFWLQKLKAWLFED